MLCTVTAARADDWDMPGGGGEKPPKGSDPKESDTKGTEATPPDKEAPDKEPQKAPATKEPTDKAEPKGTDAERTDPQTSPDAKAEAGATTESADEAVEEEASREVRVVQQKPFLKAGRVELFVAGGGAFNDPLTTHYGVTAAARVHLSPQVALSLTGFKFYGRTTDNASAIQTDFGLFPERSLIQAAGFAEVNWVPLVGKFVLLGSWVVNWDGYFILGGGVLRTNHDEDLKLGGNVGVGLRSYITRWLTFNVELRDIIFLEKFNAGSQVMQHVYGMAGIGLWIPPTYEYKYQR